MTAIGLYSIGVRGMDVPELLTWAHSAEVPFMHLRGGPRGFDLTRRDTRTLRAWRRRTKETVPITGVTADLDLSDLFTGHRADEQRARAELARLADAAAELGAGWVRILARIPLAGPIRSTMPETAVPLLVELHHPDWLTPGPMATMRELLAHCGQIRLLADTAQLAAALPRAGEHDRSALTWVLARTGVLHLSDDSGGPAAGGRAADVAADAARRIAAGQRIEVAAEWTGSDRSPATCLARYKTAASWWSRLTLNP